ncbi:MAG TPA: alkaline phosphatase family protein [Thermodesulfobacteriota bacterium]|nr:alkaline phosphatase family protein [Thermodesulfobacteriota bacterium]
MSKDGKEQKRNPIIVIGLDGADLLLIQKWSNEGYLPTITSLMNRGCWVRLNSPGDISSGSVWPTFLTGVSPDKHGFFYGHRQLKSGSYQIYKKYANQIKRRPFWDWLSQAGKRIAIFDIPQTYPVKGLNGIQIASWGAFASLWKMSSWPPELIKEIVSRFGTHPLADWYERRPEKINEYERFYKKLISGVEKTGLISAYLLDREPWDFFLMAFSETHWAGHLLWHIMDDKHPAYNPRIAKTFKNAIRDIYSAVDSTISKLIEAFPNATVLIFSLDGMGPNYSGNYLLPEILKRLGMMGRAVQNKSQSGRFSAAIEQITQLMPEKRWGPYAIRKLENLIPIKVIEIAKQMLPQEVWDTWTRRLVTAGNSWRWSKAFCVPNEFLGAIRINLKGREPNGLVEPGIEYDNLCKELTEELGSLVNVDTGENAVSDVVRVDRILQGEHISELPDLIVKWAGDAPIRALYSPRIGTVSGEIPKGRTGAHKPHGFLIASGEHISRGKTVEGANIMDIAPTIFYLMQQPVPKDMDGKVLLNIIEEEFKINNPLRYI